MAHALRRTAKPHVLLWVFFVPTCSDSKGQLHALGAAERGNAAEALGRGGHELQVGSPLQAGRCSKCGNTCSTSSSGCSSSRHTTVLAPNPSSSSEQVPQLVMFTTQQLQQLILLNRKSGAQALQSQQAPTPLIGRGTLIGGGTYRIRNVNGSSSMAGGASLGGATAAGCS